MGQAAEQSATQRAIPSDASEGDHVLQPENGIEETGHLAKYEELE